LRPVGGGMDTGVPSIPYLILRNLSRAVSQGTFDFEMLVAAAEEAGLGLGEFAWGIYAQVGPKGEMGAMARQVWAAIKLLGEYPMIREALNAARLAAATLPALAEEATRRAALTVVGETATAIGSSLGLEGGTALVVGGAIGLTGLALLGVAVWYLGHALFGTAGAPKAAAAGIAITANATPHPCADASIGYDASWSWYNRIYGGGGSSDLEKAGYICNRNTYTTYRDGAFTGYVCAADWTNCRRDDKPPQPIDTVEEKDGVTIYHYGNGESAGVRKPL
jgi:hypothetical protein